MQFLFGWLGINMVAMLHCHVQWTKKLILLIKFLVKYTYLIGKILM